MAPLRVCLAFVLSHLTDAPRWGFLLRLAEEQGLEVHHSLEINYWLIAQKYSFQSVGMFGDEPVIDLEGVVYFETLLLNPLYI